ncbi:hypothetical protein [Undibacterium sp.]|uniref:hypothetical protein n=1 Tax=Undibacterium sp. TaxID=1914977 RepID=UPI00374D0DE4
MKNRFAHCIFCDSIIQEEGNKFSFIGVYGPDLVMDQMPSSIPRLCVVPTFNAGIDDPVKSLKVVIRLGDEVLQEVETPAAYLEGTRQVFVDAAGDKPEGINAFYKIQASVTPLNFSKASVLEVAVIADGQEYIAGRLQIKTAT